VRIVGALQQASGQDVLRLGVRRGGSQRAQRAAIVDRRTFRGDIIEAGTVSYRLAHARAQRAAQPTRE